MDTQKPIAPPDLLAAARLIRDNCKNSQLCLKCIFHDDYLYGCLLFEETPSEWVLSDVESRIAQEDGII